jgi:hypothetical protein
MYHARGLGEPPRKTRALGGDLTASGECGGEKVGDAEAERLMLPEKLAAEKLAARERRPI